MNALNWTRTGIRPEGSSRTEGSTKQTAGGSTEGAGNSLAREKVQRSGQAAQGKGKLKKTLGIAKDKAGDSDR